MSHASPHVLDPETLAELDRRTRRLGAFFDLAALDSRGETTAEIARYYEQSRLGYRFVHSREGAMHMALNPSGTFDPSGYDGQANLVWERMDGAITDVLELACGNGYNLGLLAPRDRARRYRGIDLVPSQIERARETLAHEPNVELAVGDFQSLAFADGSQDLVFVVESFCHATDLARAFEEVRRVLRPGGRFVVIDAWRTERYVEASAAVRQTAARVERAMAVAGAETVDEWKATAREHGLEPIEVLDLSEQIKPNLERLAKGANKFLSHPRLASIARALLPRPLIENVVAGYLMPVTVDLGVHTYGLITLERAS